MGLQNTEEEKGEAPGVVNNKIEICQRVQLHKKCRRDTNPTKGRK